MTCCQPRTACEAGECDDVDDGCGGTLDCGPCCEADCAGKACGGDGCGGSCGDCASGQRCDGGTCVCDAASCAGCCDAAGACRSGDEDDACGTGGVACVACTGDEVCGGTTPGVCGERYAGDCDASPTSCAYLDGPCATGVCDPTAGGCVAVPRREGEPCGGPAEGSSLCLTGGTCVNGQCTGATTSTCQGASDDCNDFMCVEDLGCIPVLKQDNTPCTPGVCYQPYSGGCQNGVCTGGTPVPNGTNPIGAGGGVCPGNELCSHGECRICVLPGEHLGSDSCFTGGHRCCGGCIDEDAGYAVCTS